MLSESQRVVYPVLRHLLVRSIVEKIAIEGEIFFEGNQIGLGYLKSVKLLNDIDFASVSTEKFKVLSNSARRLLTGDFGRLVGVQNARSGGFSFEILLLGRKEKQVKVNGKGIDLSEVEGVFYKLQNIVQRVFVVCAHGRSGISNNIQKRIYCYLVFFQSFVEDSRKLCFDWEPCRPLRLTWLPKCVERFFRKFSSLQLPSHMCPDVFVALKSENPLMNSNDKVVLNKLLDNDRIPLLPSVIGENVIDSGVKASELTLIQGIVVNFCRNRLKITRLISLEDSFQSIGGDSLSAQRVSLDLSARFCEKGIISKDLYERIRKFGEFNETGQEENEVNQGNQLKVIMSPLYLLASRSLREFCQRLSISLGSESSVETLNLARENETVKLSETEECDRTNLLNGLAFSGSSMLVQSLLDVSVWGSTALCLINQILEKAKSKAFGSLHHGKFHIIIASICKLHLQLCDLALTERYRFFLVTKRTLLLQDQKESLLAT